LLSVSQNSIPGFPDNWSIFRLTVPHITVGIDIADSGRWVNVVIMTAQPSVKLQSRIVTAEIEQSVKSALDVADIPAPGMYDVFH
jgi:hypothetical protein